MQKQTDERCNYSWRSVVSGNMFMVLQGQTRFDFVRTGLDVAKTLSSKETDSTRFNYDWLFPQATTGISPDRAVTRPSSVRARQRGSRSREDEGKSKSLQRNARPNLSAKANLLPVSIVHPITGRFSSWT